MACIEAHGLRKAFGTRSHWTAVDLRVEEGRILGTHRSQRCRQDHRAERNPRPHSLPGATESPGTRPLDRTRSAHVRCLLHFRCCRAAALDQGFPGARLCSRRASTIRSRQGGRFSCQDHHQPRQQGEGIVQGHGGSTAPRPGDGHRRQTAGAGRADARPGHPVSQAILRFACSTTTSIAAAPSS